MDPNIRSCGGDYYKDHTIKKRGNANTKWFDDECRIEMKMAINTKEEIVQIECEEQRKEIRKVCGGRKKAYRVGSKQEVKMNKTNPNTDYISLKISHIIMNENGILDRLRKNL